MCVSYLCACAHVAQSDRKTRSGFHNPPQMTSSTQLFCGRTLPSFSKEHASLSFSVNAQLYMLQISCYAGRNPRTTMKESKTN